MSTRTLSGHFWPSSRLWEKFLIGLFFVPALFTMLIWLFVRSAFSSPPEQPLYFWLFMLALIGGPIAVGVSLRWPWRALGGGIALAVALPIIWYGFPRVGTGMHLIDTDPEAGIAAVGIACLLELMAGDANERKGRIGLACGVAVGLLLLSANRWLAGDIHHEGPDNVPLMILSWWVPTVLASLSILFFPEWLSRRVGWGGALVWCALVACVLGLSATLLR